MSNAFIATVRIAALAALVVCGLWRLRAGGPGANDTALEALERLKGMDLETHPALKEAVLRILDGFRGKPQFVELVRDFHLAGQEEGLIEIARKFPGESAGAEAVRMLYQAAASQRLDAALETGDAPQREGLLKSIANSGEPHGIPLLSRVARDSASLPALRAASIQGLARTEAGARELLRLGRAGELSEGLRTTAGLALAQSRWPDIRQEASEVLPPPRSADSQTLPPISELVAMTGDPKRGAEVFRSEQVGCIKCHQVGNEGVEFGPALSQIGTKLARQAIYESILDPSAGIAFGYEGWEVETGKGEEFFGIIVSETPDELVIRQQGAVVVRVKKSDITRREKMRLSVMPAALAEVMTRQELVDLVEYLTTLKAP